MSRSHVIARLAEHIVVGLFILHHYSVLFQVKHILELDVSSGASWQFQSVTSDADGGIYLIKIIVIVGTSGYDQASRCQEHRYEPHCKYSSVHFVFKYRLNGYLLCAQTM